MVSILSVQFCHCTAKAAVEIQMSGRGYVSIKLYLETQAVGHSFPPLV